MAFTHNPSKVVPYWLLFSTLTVIMDSSYIFLRPRSMIGGDLHFPFFIAWGIYSKIDLVYGFRALEENNGFAVAQSCMNIVECILNLYYVQAWFGRGPGKVRPGEVLIGYTAVTMTFSKTVLYMMTEACSGWDNIRSDNVIALFFLYILPNCLWIVFPMYCMSEFSKDITRGLRSTQAGKSK